MKARDILLYLAILAFGATAAYAAYQHHHEAAAPLPGSVSSDGAPSIPEGAQVFSARIGQRIESNGLAATPIALVEDSRCPQDVQCIQAGTVKVSVKFEYGALSRTQTFALNEPVTIAGITGTLIDVSPEKESGTALTGSDYIFTFEVHR